MLLLHQTVSGYSAAQTKRKLKEQWQSIDWAKANRIVKSLQRRIVAAIKAGRWGKVKSLQWILTHSFSAKVLAIRRVTENTGSRTSGVDGQTWNKTEDKFQAVNTLKRSGYKAEAVRRVKIPKTGGKYRMLGIPTMRDRAMQALYLQALQPIAETLADHHSYGFRPYRSCHDAIKQCFNVLSRPKSAQYVLEGDIRACFDKISHQFILDNIPTDKQVLKEWLKSGVVDRHNWYPTEEGTPQGSIISPTIANMVLDGMQEVIDKIMGIRYYQSKNGYRSKLNNPYRVHFIRYADDWIITATDKETLEQIIKPAIEDFLKERGLELSKEKTVITNIYDGFDFLGQNFRKYGKSKLIIKPSKKSLNKLLDKVRLTIKQMRTVPSYVLITHINKMTKGWAMYHRFCNAKQTFIWIDYQLWKLIWQWCLRRHPTKGRKWVAKKYFTSHKNYKWTFFGKDTKSTFYLFRISTIPIRRHYKIRGAANPFAKEDELIFEQHLQRKMLNTWHKKRRLITIFRRQSGKCPMCHQHITKQTGWHIHHKLERYKGGKDTLDNLVMLHPNCHHQVHYWNIQFDGDVPIRTFEQA
jgi:RNA-directed DNA polymerase